MGSAALALNQCLYIMVVQTQSKPKIIILMSNSFEYTVDFDAGKKLSPHGQRGD